MATKKAHRYLFLTLCSVCMSLGNIASAMAITAGDARPGNEAIAKAYKSAIDHFIKDLTPREGEEKLARFMASLESYQSEVLQDDEGFCIVFSPKDFEGGPVFGGSISYCFDDAGTVLKTVTASK